MEKGIAAPIDKENVRNVDRGRLCIYYRNDLHGKGCRPQENERGIGSERISSV